ncbi:MAG: NERD domain-containing protein [Leptospiraceae bacterium]|nr:NERD domain-containing protein [Leptospiraceae bacterium]
MIYPDQFPENQKFDNSKEKEFYIRFRRELPSDWDMFYSYKFFMPGVPIREVDYIVVCPLGIFLIELKNAKFKFQEGQWLIYDSREKVWKLHKKGHYTGPIEQIETAVKSFEKFLEINHHDDLPVSEDSFLGAVFLNKNEAHQINKNIKNYAKIIFHKELEKKRLDVILEELANVFHLEPITQQEQETIRNIILLNGNYVPTYKQRRDEQVKKILALTLEQMKTIDKIKTFPRILITGVPGSGKTMLAIRALEIASQNKWNTLFICPTVAMANQFEEYFKKDNFVNVYNFHSIQELNGLKDKFHFIVIEEAQNLTPELRILAEDLLIGGWRGGRWAIIMDEGQATEKIYYQLWADLTPEWQKLTINIRNPKEIYEIACILGKKLVHPPSVVPDAVNVKFLAYETEEQMHKLLLEVINYAYEQMDVNLEDIIILSTYSYEELNLDAVKNISSKQFTNYPIINVESGIVHEGRVGFSRIREFVGLEASFVILLGLDSLSEVSCHEYYIALTRSNYGASVIYDINIKQELVELFDHKI